MVPFDDALHVDGVREKDLFVFIEIADKFDDAALVVVDTLDGGSTRSSVRVMRTPLLRNAISAQAGLARMLNWKSPVSNTPSGFRRGHQARTEVPVRSVVPITLRS